MHVSPFSRRRRRNCRGFGYSQRSEIRAAGSQHGHLAQTRWALSRARVHMAMTPTRRCSTSPAASSPRGRPTGGIYPNRLLTRPEFIPRAIRVLTPFAHPHSVESRTTAMGTFLRCGSLDRPRSALSTRPFDSRGPLRHDRAPTVPLHRLTKPAPPRPETTPSRETRLLSLKRH